MTLLVALGYQTGTGKNTVAAILRDQLQSLSDARVSISSFMTGAKAAAHAAYGVYGLKPGPYYETGPGRREKLVTLPGIGKTPVELWIATQAEMKRQCETIKVDQFAASLQACHVGIATDLRDTIECHAIRNRGGLLVHVVRSDVMPLDTAQDHELDAWESWDWTITNNGTLDDLRRECAVLTNHLVERLTSC